MAANRYELSVCECEVRYWEEDFLDFYFERKHYTGRKLGIHGYIDFIKQIEDKARDPISAGEEIIKLHDLKDWIIRNGNLGEVNAGEEDEFVVFWVNDEMLTHAVNKKQIPVQRFGKPLQDKERGEITKIFLIKDWPADWACLFEWLSHMRAVKKIDSISITIKCLEEGVK